MELDNLVVYAAAAFGFQGNFHDLKEKLVEEDKNEDIKDFEYDGEEEYEKVDEEEDQYIPLYFKMQNHKPPNREALNDAIQERNCKIRRKKDDKETKERVLDIIQDSSNEGMSVKSLQKLTSAQEEVKQYLYIPQKNLLLLLLNDMKTVKFFNTVNFKAVKTKKCDKNINMIKYSDAYNKVFFGGDDYYLEVYNIAKFCTEQVSPRQASYNIYDVMYWGKQKALVVGIGSKAVDILNLSLTLRHRFPCDAYAWRISSMINLNSNVLLAVFQSSLYNGNFKQLWVCDMKGKKTSLYAGVCPNSCVEVVRKGSFKVVTCLMEAVGQTCNATTGYPLIQLKLDTVDKELAMHKSASDSLRFSDMYRIQNTHYFVVRTVESQQQQRIMILDMSKDEFELIRTVSNSSCFLSEINIFAKMKDLPIVIGVDERDKSVSVYSIKNNNKAVKCNKAE